MVLPEAVQSLIGQGYTLVDVRSEPEFALGHIPGAVSVPLQHPAADVLVDNPDFLAVMKVNFAPATPLLLVCASGARSRRAVGLLRAAGYHQAEHVERGFSGARDPFGRRLPGWLNLGLLAEVETPPDHGYATLLERARRAGAVP
jgi:rhodanese-related sulfurtransferase